MCPRYLFIGLVTHVDHNKSFCDQIYYICVEPNWSQKQMHRGWYKMKLNRQHICWYWWIDISTDSRYFNDYKLCNHTCFCTDMKQILSESFAKKKKQTHFHSNLTINKLDYFKFQIVNNYPFFSNTLLPYSRVFTCFLLVFYSLSFSHL